MMEEVFSGLKFYGHHSSQLHILQAPVQNYKDFSSQCPTPNIRKESCQKLIKGVFRINLRVGSPKTFNKILNSEMIEAYK